MRFYSRFLNCLHDDAYCDGRDPACFHCYRHRVNAALVLDAIIVIAQYARDQAMGSARDQAAKVSLRRVDHYHGEHTPGICLESSKNGKLV